MRQKPTTRFGDFMEGKGFYIVLFLCVTAIGISGYFLFSGLMPKNPLAVDDPMQQVAGHNSQVDVPYQVPVVTIPPKIIDPAQETANPADTQETAATPDQPAAPSYVWPVRGNISKDYSLEVFAYDETMGDWRTHAGLDISAELGTEVLATSAGIVSAVEEDPLMGTMVIIDHGQGLQSVYANLAAAPTVTPGDQVSPGVVIGTIGKTAIAESVSAPHLHFEMLQDGVAIDPVAFLPAGN